MRFEQLYKKYIGIWPEEIDISDGYPVNNDGYMFPTLSKIYDKIEDSLDHKKEHWAYLCCWSFFQVFHKEAKNLKSDGKNILYTRKVDKIKMDNCIRENLKGKDWENENKNYKGL